MEKRNKISRRDFLNFFSINLAGLAFKNLHTIADWAAGWPSLNLSDLPVSVSEILKLVPNTMITRNGYLYLLNEYKFPIGGLPVVPTQWNKERSEKVDELFHDQRWGIVLHWYGNEDDNDRTIKGYMYGFNGIRHITNYETRTSAHFLVGDKAPTVQIKEEEGFMGIAQTQVASPKGVPYLASHLNNFYVRSFEGDHYFVNALYKLGLVNTSINPVLINIFEGPKFDPNFCTIAIELTGSDFDEPANHPSNQKIANVLSVVWAVMQRYRIRAIDVLGHNEIQLTNSDPGKKFMALIRYLIGVMALVKGDDMMRYQVFAPFLGDDGIPANAVKRYFEYVRDFLVLVGLPEDVFEWEVWSKYWFVFDRILGQTAPEIAMKDGHPPLLGDSTNPGNWFLDPENHEGIDIYSADRRNQMVNIPSDAYLVTNGKCIFIGENRGFHHGKTAIFRHRQPNGAELLTVYGHLNVLSNLEVGKTYSAGHRLGCIGNMEDGTHSFLHFSTAYGATWDTHLRQNPNVPLSANTKWVQRHFIHPEEFLDQLIYQKTRSIMCLTDVKRNQVVSHIDISRDGG
jgi:hypothetical protein